MQRAVLLYWKEPYLAPLAVPSQLLAVPSQALTAPHDRRATNRSTRSATDSGVMAVRQCQSP